MQGVVEAHVREPAEHEEVEAEGGEPQRRERAGRPRAPEDEEGGEQEDEADPEGAPRGRAPEQRQAREELAARPRRLAREAEGAVLGAQQVSEEPGEGSRVAPAHGCYAGRGPGQVEVGNEAEDERGHEAAHKSRRRQARPLLDQEKHEGMVVREPEAEPEGRHPDGGERRSRQPLGQEDETGHEQVVEGEDLGNDCVGPDEGREREGARGQDPRGGSARPEPGGGEEERGRAGVAPRREEAHPPRDPVEGYKGEELREQRVQRVARGVGHAEHVGDRDQLAAVAPVYRPAQAGEVEAESDEGGPEQGGRVRSRPGADGARFRPLGFGRAPGAWCFGLPRAPSLASRAVCGCGHRADPTAWRFSGQTLVR